MIIKRFVVGPIEANNYLVVDEESKEAVLIDCSEKSDEILKAVRELGAKVKYILLTHGHFDHVLGVNEMKELLGAKALIHQKDLSQLANNNTILGVFGMKGAKMQETDGFVNDGDELVVGNPPAAGAAPPFDKGGLNIKVIHTPGHTEGCVCYLIEDKLFSGDTLFLESVGRTDLMGGDFKTMLNSIKEVLFKLDPKTIVNPGHGPETTIEHEMQYNEIL